MIAAHAFVPVAVATAHAFAIPFATAITAMGLHAAVAGLVLASPTLRVIVAEPRCDFIARSLEEAAIVSAASATIFVAVVRPSGTFVTRISRVVPVISHIGSPRLGTPAQAGWKLGKNDRRLIAVPVKSMLRCTNSVKRLPDRIRDEGPVNIREHDAL